MESILTINYKLENIQQAVKEFWELAKRYRCFAFSGDLGAGKTTFIHALCDHLGVKDAVSSPTYALINEYHFEDDSNTNIVYHMDWYRLRDEDEAIHAGMEDCLQNIQALSFIEWPERAPALLSSPYLWITIEHRGEDERHLNVFLR